jgi:fatty acid desaturase
MAREHTSDIFFEQESIPKIEPEALKRLSKLKPWRSCLAISADWLAIILCIALCQYVSYWCYPVAFIVAGTRYHGLEAMMHEAAHYRLHSNKKINEFIGELSAWPMGFSLFIYRHIRHFSHHRNIGTAKDAHVFQIYERYPDRFNTPLTPWQLVKNCVATSLQFPREMWLGQIYRNARLLPALSKGRAGLWIGFQSVMFLSIVAGSVVWGLNVAWIYLLFFVLPFVWVAVSGYLRLLAEHFGIRGEHGVVVGGNVRTVLVSWPIRVMLWPHNLNYHLEHHWYPSVPFYNLPALHELLYGSPQIRKRMHVTRGLKNLFRELTFTSYDR